MQNSKPFGLYLFQKDHPNQQVLKDLLQLLKSNLPSKSVNFAYVEAQTSLIPNLSLWENLRLEVGGRDWKEFCDTLSPDFRPMANLLKNPDLTADNAEVWEKFTVSFLKGILTSSQNLLIDMNEGLFSPFLIQSYKKTFLNACTQKNIYLASANSSLWLDCSHSVVSRKGYQFVVENLDQERIRNHWAA